MKVTPIRDDGWRRSGETATVPSAVFNPRAKSPKLKTNGAVTRS
jgi:hypothetical protein